MKARFINCHDKSVKMTSVFSLFSISEIEEMLGLGVKVGCCHRNAAVIADYFESKGVMYCEGLCSDLSHAWNKIGDKYFDIIEVLKGVEPKCFRYKLKRLYTANNINELASYEKMYFLTFKRRDISLDNDDIFYDDYGNRRTYGNAA